MINIHVSAKNKYNIGTIWSWLMETGTICQDSGHPAWSQQIPRQTRKCDQCKKNELTTGGLFLDHLF